MTAEAAGGFWSGAGGAIGGGLIGGGLGLLTSIGNNRTLASAKEAELKGQTFGIQQGAETTKWGLYGNLANQIAANRWNFEIGPDQQLNRDIYARAYDLNVFSPKEEGRQRENLRWQTSYRSDPAFKTASQQENIANVKFNPDRIKKQGELSGIFGGIAQPPLGSFMVT